MEEVSLINSLTSDWRRDLTVPLDGPETRVSVASTQSNVAESSAHTLLATGNRVARIANGKVDTFSGTARRGAPNFPEPRLAVDLRQTMDVLVQSYTRAEFDRIVKGETYMQAMGDIVVPTILDISTTTFSDAKLQRRPYCPIPFSFAWRWRPI